jgi:hypothetical protein
MKSRYKTLCFIFTVTTVFFILSCYRNTPPPAADEIVYLKTVDYEPVTIQYTGQNDPVSAADGSMKFTPLKVDERFAYSTQWKPERLWQNMTMYAVRNNDIENAIELFAWEPVNWDSIQFTSDLKKAFFIESYPTVGIDRENNLYMANGLTGETRILLTNFGYSPYRASKDGKFVCYYRGSNREPMTIMLFDVEKEAIVGNFEWNPILPLANKYGYIAWTVRRSDSHFGIYGSIDSGFIFAAARLDPEAMKFEVLWDLSDPDAITSSLPSIDDAKGEWNDDVRSQRESARLLEGNR